MRNPQSAFRIPHSAFDNPQFPSTLRSVAVGVNLAVGVSSAAADVCATLTALRPAVTKGGCSICGVARPAQNGQPGRRGAKRLHVGVIPLSISERKKEIKRRRKRREQLGHLKKRLEKATKSEQVEITRKLREVSPGAEVLIAGWGLSEVDR
jgi:hypothetical protein